VTRQERAQRTAEWLERHPRFMDTFQELMALGFAGFGLALVTLYPEWDFPWFPLAMGVGMLAARWTRPISLLVLALVSFGLSVAAAGGPLHRPLHLTSLVFFALWMGGPRLWQRASGGWWAKP